MDTIKNLKDVTNKKFEFLGISQGFYIYKSGYLFFEFTPYDKYCRFYISNLVSFSSANNISSAWSLFLSEMEKLKDIMIDIFIEDL